MPARAQKREDTTVLVAGFKKSEPQSDVLSMYVTRNTKVVKAILAFTTRSGKGTDELKKGLEKIRTDFGLTFFEFTELVKEACRAKLHEPGADTVRVKVHKRADAAQTDILIRRRYFEIAQLLVIFNIKPEDVFGKSG